MARDSQTPNISKSNLEVTVSSDDLLKQAWESMGRMASGDRIEEAGGSSSRNMTTSANRTSDLTSLERTATAEEIAQMLRQETELRQGAQGGRSQARRVAAPTPERPTQERPRRAPPIAPPPTRKQVPPDRVRPSRRTTEDDGTPRRRRGAGWAIFAAIWIIASIVGGALENFGGDSGPPAVEVTTPTTVLVPDATNASIRDLEPGTCIATLPIGETVNQVPTVPCEEPHQYELFANTSLTGAEFPGDAVFDEAFDVCSALFFDYVGENYASSSWYVDVITPTEEGWNKLGDRAVNCLLYEWDEDALDVVDVTGTARGSGDAAG